MNSRERVAAAVDRREPDMVPIDLNGTIVTSLTRVAYDNLRAFLNLPPDENPEVNHKAMDTVRSLPDLLERYEVDTRAVGMGSPDKGGDRLLPDGDYYDEFGHRWRKASYYYDVVEHPLTGKSPDCLASMPWPDEDDPGRYRGLRDKALAIRGQTDKCLVLDIPGLGPFEGGCFLRGHGDFCADFYEDPDFAEAIMDKVTDSMIAFWGHLLDEVGDLVDVVAQGDDVGMQNSMFLSPEMYRRFVKPRKKRLFSFIKGKTGAKVFYHSCGAVSELIRDFIDEGVDILNPVQRGAAGMEISRLKREFGKDVCFWGGGIDVQRQLPFMSPDEIEDELKRTFDIMMPGGGFVFFPTHNIQADVSPDRIDRMFETVMRIRKY